MGEILGLVLVVVREEARAPFSVVACMCIGLNWIKSRCLLLIYFNIHLQLEYWQQVNFLIQIRDYSLSCFKFIFCNSTWFCLPLLLPFFCCLFHNALLNVRLLLFLYISSFYPTDNFISPSCIWIWKKRRRERKKEEYKSPRTI